jgi:hypothetical protein
MTPWGIEAVAFRLLAPPLTTAMDKFQRKKGAAAHSWLVRDISLRTSENLRIADRGL